MHSAITIIAAFFILTARFIESKGSVFKVCTATEHRLTHRYLYKYPPLQHKPPVVNNTAIKSNSPPLNYTIYLSCCVSIVFIWVSQEASCSNVVTMKRIIYWIINTVLPKSSFSSSQFLVKPICDAKIRKQYQTPKSFQWFCPLQSTCCPFGSATWVRPSPRRPSSPSPLVQSIHVKWA